MTFVACQSGTMPQGKISNLNGQIAAITHSRGLSAATRNIRDFKECQVDAINPFSE